MHGAQKTMPHGGELPALERRELTAGDFVKHVIASVAGDKLGIPTRCIRDLDKLVSDMKRSPHQGCNMPDFLNRISITEGKSNDIRTGVSALVVGGALRHISPGYQKLSLGEELSRMWLEDLSKQPKEYRDFVNAAVAELRVRIRAFMEG